MSESSDLGIKWPRWDIMLFEEPVAVDMRVVCPQRRRCFCNKLGLFVGRDERPRHECEELKEGVWPINESWTDTHRSAMRKLVAGEGWVQKRLYDIGWSDEKKCRCDKEEGTEERRLHRCLPWREVRNQKSKGLGEW